MVVLSVHSSKTLIKTLLYVVASSRTEKTDDLGQRAQKLQDSMSKRNPHPRRVGAVGQVCRPPPACHGGYMVTGCNSSQRGPACQPVSTCCMGRPSLPCLYAIMGHNIKPRVLGVGSVLGTQRDDDASPEVVEGKNRKI